MTYRRLVAFNAAVYGLLLAACGDYSDNQTTSTNSTTGAGLTTGEATSTSTTTGGLETTTSPATTATATSDTSSASASTTGDATTGDSSTTTGAGGASSTTGGTSTTGAIEASCDNVTACGGDVVGTWAVAGSCLPITGDADVTGFGLNCTGGPIEGALEVSGTITFGDDGKVTDNTVTSGQGVVAMPAACKEISGTTTTCERLEGPFINTGWTTAECVDDAETEGCSCTVTADQTGAMAFLSLDPWTSASYSTADTTLTVSVFGDPWEYAYCVEDTQLTMSTQSVSKVGTLTGTIALLKQ